MPDVTHNDVLAYLKVHAPDIAGIVEKNLTPGDVHQATALGNEKDKNGSKPAKPFKALIEQARAAHTDKDGEVGKRAEWTIQITKADPEKQIIAGWASVSTLDGQHVVDKQGDVIFPVDLDEAAQNFVLSSRSQGDMHEQRDVGRLCGGVVFTAEKLEKCGIGAFDIETGKQIEGWYVEFKVDDAALWKKMKAGERPEFSIGGRGTRVPIA